MNMDPDPKSIGTSLLYAGMTAASHPEDFSGCPNKCTNNTAPGAPAMRSEVNGIAHVRMLDCSDTRAF